MYLVNQRRSFAMNVNGFQRTLFSPSSSPLIPVQLPSPMYNHDLVVQLFKTPKIKLFRIVFYLILQGSSFLVRFARASEESEFVDSVFGNPIAV